MPRRAPSPAFIAASHWRRSLESIGGFGSLGVRWKFARPESRLNAFFDVCYHVHSISSALNAANDENKVITTGATDLFHAPTAALGATF